MTEDLREEGPSVNRRRRSTGFPVVSLAEASAILKEAGKYGFEHSTAAFATYMGHSTTNSGAFRQRLAAFRDLKLIAGRGDSLAMTDIGRMIAVPTDERSERQALQAAFMNSPEFLRLYEGSGKGQPLAAGPLGGRAVHDFGIAPSSKDKFVESFSESAIAAGLAERNDEEQLVLLVPENGASSADARPTRPPTTFPSEPESGAVRQVSTPHGTPPVIHQTWEIDRGMITFEIATSKPLPASVFVTVGEVVASLERLAGTLAPAPSSSANEGAED
ncbi:MAG: hypothetical protein ACLP0L_13520 [Solirubrobacteraceae bacterium]